jgi:hypothetical protein
MTSGMVKEIPEGHANLRQIFKPGSKDQPLFRKTYYFSHLMHKLLTLVSLVFLTLPVKAQNGRNDLINLKPLGISLPAIHYEKKLPFSQIEVIDCRYDTTKIGYIRKNGSFKKLIVPAGLQPSLDNILNMSLAENFDPAQNQSLLVVIKRLWLKETNQAETEKRKMVVADNASLLKFSACSFKLEVYLKKEDNFTPLLRLDSSLSYENSLKRYGGDIVMAPFELCLLRLQNINFEKAAASSKKLNWKTVEDYNQQQFNKPILKNPPLQRGLYLSFSDFLQNKLTVKDFEVEYGNLTDQLYLVNKGEKTLYTDFWGFCDGGKLYIRSGLNFYELFKQHNTFEFVGSIGIEKKTIDALSPYTENGTALPLNTYPFKVRNEHVITNNLKPYQLNMENGDVN